MPDLGGRLIKRLAPFMSQLRGELPAKLVITQSHAHQMTPLLGSLSIDKALTSVKDSQVVDEMHITGLGADLKLRSLGNVFNGIQCLNLTSSQLGKMLWAWMNGISHEWYTAKIDDQSSLVMKKDWATLESRPGMSLAYKSRQRLLSNTHMANGQSDRARVRIKSGRLAAMTL